jgi:micrococcal nuclease
MTTMRRKGLFLSLIVQAIFLLYSVAVVRSTVASPLLQEARVTAVHDGDTVTLLLNGKTQRTRLIGIDAPEMVQEPWGKRSREHLRKIIKDLRWNVSIETDIQPYDKYDRLLVYLWADRERLINQQMLSDGFALLFTIQPNSRYADRFRNAQRQARENKLGIWGPEGLRERPLEYKKRHPRNDGAAGFADAPRKRDRGRP